MFIRIYTGLLFSALLAGLLSYGFYHWQHQQRHSEYLHTLFNGSFHLLNKGLERHDGEKQSRWLQVMERLMGAKIELRGLETIAPSSLRFEHGAENETILLFRQGERELRSVINEVTEQHYRMMATLIRNELGRLDASNRMGLITEELEAYFPGLKLIDIGQVQLDPQQMSRLKRFDTVVSESRQHDFFVYSRIPSSDRIIVIGPLAGFNPLPLSNLITMMLMSLLITAASAYWLVFRIERRIKSIQLGVNEFSKQPTQLPELSEDIDAIGGLAWSINSMSFRIHQLLSDQKQMIQAISHELRTPMSRMKFRLQVLEEDELSAASQKSLKGIGRDIDEVNGLIKEALDFDRGSLQHQMNSIELNEMSSEIIRDLMVEFTSVNIIFSASASHCYIKQDSQQIKRLLQNLMQNACKYGQGEVMVSILDQGVHWLMNVEDNGLGIPDELKLSVFSPFTRVETSRNKQTGGMGLGLAIAKNIADLAAIKLTLNDSILGGACFSMVIPKADLDPSDNSEQESK
jgi:two-component system, OmpR family, sensor histidine kinase RstB